MVTAADIPPLRLDFLKTAIHPTHVSHGGCTDKDCLYNDCKGNRIEIINSQQYGGGGAGRQAGDDGETSDPEGDGDHHDECLDSVVVFHVVHGKNDRKDATPVRFKLPEGALKVILEAYIIEGREILGSGPLAQQEEEPNKVFVTGGYRDFNDVTFAQYWEGLLKRTATQKFGIQHFAATRARTLFVEDYTQHMPENQWGAAAVVMGNSSRQWQDSYWPRRRERLAQLATTMHEEYVQRRMQGGGGGGGGVF